MKSYSDDRSDAMSQCSQSSTGSSSDDDAHPHDIDWLNQFKGVRVRVPAWWWNNCNELKLYDASIISVHPERHDGTYFQFRLDADSPRTTYFMNYPSLRRFVHKKDPHQSVLRRFNDPKPNPHVELDEEESSSSDDDSECTSDDDDLDESRHPQSFEGEDTCPLDVRWLRSLIGFRVNVPDHWWNGFTGKKKNPASIIAIDAHRSDTTSYFQFELDEDRARNIEREFNDPSDRVTYFMNYDSVLLYQDKKQDGYLGFDLPSTPRLNPHLTASQEWSGKFIHHDVVF